MDALEYRQESQKHIHASHKGHKIEVIRCDYGHMFEVKALVFMGRSQNDIYSTPYWEVSSHVAYDPTYPEIIAMQKRAISRACNWIDGKF